MFAEFSRGYYLGRLYVEPRDGERAVVHSDLHEQVNEQLYAVTEEPRVPNKPVLKLDGRHFPVDSEEGLPPDTLAVPESIVMDVGYGERRVLLAKPDTATLMLELSGWEVKADGEVVHDRPGPSRDQARCGPAVFDESPRPFRPS